MLTLIVTGFGMLFLTVFVYIVSGGQTSDEGEVLHRLLFRGFSGTALMAIFTGIIILKWDSMSFKRRTPFDRSLEWQEIVEREAGFRPKKATKRRR